MNTDDLINYINASKKMHAEMLCVLEKFQNYLADHENESEILALINLQKETANVSED